MVLWGISPYQGPSEFTLGYILSISPFFFHNYSRYEIHRVICNLGKEMEILKHDTLSWSHLLFWEYKWKILKIIHFWIARYEIYGIIRNFEKINEICYQKIWKEILSWIAVLISRRSKIWGVFASSVKKSKSNHIWKKLCSVYNFHNVIKNLRRNMIWSQFKLLKIKNLRWSAFYLMRNQI